MWKQNLADSVGSEADVQVPSAVTTTLAVKANSCFVTSSFSKIGKFTIVFLLVTSSDRGVTELCTEAGHFDFAMTSVVAV